MNRSGSLEKRFQERFERTENGCWNWSGYLNEDGYGKLWDNRRGVFAHRLAYELFKGPIPAGLYVCHQCDNPRCVNPEHLFVGSQRDNVLDASAKGRTHSPRNVGEKNRSAKLTESDASAIRASIEPTRTLADRYGISRGNVWLIKKGKTWNAK